MSTEDLERLRYKMPGQGKVRLLVQRLHVPSLCQSKHAEVCHSESVEILAETLKSAVAELTRHNGVEPCWRYCLVGVKYE